jgi:hypothetical protein
MFQTFASEADPSKGAERVARLRAWLAGHGLDGFLVPRADEHQGEYVAARSERLRWLTGFAGSAGMALVLTDKALIFVDGRYTLQVRDQADMTVFTPESLIDNPPSAWIAGNAGKGTRIGMDPWLHTIGEVRGLKNAADQAGAEIVALDNNPIDAIWDDQPGPPLERVSIQPFEHAGELARDGPLLRRLGLQHPRRRRAAHAAGTGFRHPFGRRPAAAFHGQAQAADRDRGLSDAALRPARAGDAGGRTGRSGEGGCESGARPAARRRPAARHRRGQRWNGGLRA